MGDKAERSTLGAEWRFFIATNLLAIGMLSALWMFQDLSQGNLIGAALWVANTGGLVAAIVKMVKP